MLACASRFAANMSFLTHAGLRALARSMARTIGPLFAPPLKVLVTDLDNTLWGGILGEDGNQGIRLTKSDGGVAYRHYGEFL